MTQCLPCIPMGPDMGLEQGLDFTLTCPPWTYLNLGCVNLDEGTHLDLEFIERPAGLTVLDRGTSW